MLLYTPVCETGAVSACLWVKGWGSGAGAVHDNDNERSSATQISHSACKTSDEFNHDQSVKNPFPNYSGISDVVSLSLAIEGHG